MLHVACTSWVSALFGVLVCPGWAAGCDVAVLLLMPACIHWLLCLKSVLCMTFADLPVLCVRQ
jgi:hypothetical protein